jgi:hypothetical protein
MAELMSGAAPAAPVVKVARPRPAAAPPAPAAPPPVVQAVPVIYRVEAIRASKRSEETVR